MIDIKWSRNTFWEFGVWVTTLELGYAIGRKSQQPADDHSKCRSRQRCLASVAFSHQADLG